MRGYGDTVFQYCGRSLGDRALAEDVHQQVFVQAYEDLPRYSHRSSLRTWLFGIAHHRCLDAVRGRRRGLSRFSPLEDAPEVEDASPTPDRGLELGAVQRTVGECLQKLALRARQAVTLRFAEGFTYEEMSHISNEKPGTLQARVARALPLLRRCLQNAERGESS